MTDTIDRYQPSFHRFPMNNDRTGFQPVYLPLVLVVPGRKDANGRYLANSGVKDVRFYIADAPEQSLVAGPFIYTSSGPVVNNMLIPALSKYVINITDLELEEIKIDLTNVVFYDGNGNVKNYEDATEGDTFEYTLVRGNIKSTMPYYPDADYYDMSLYTIDVEDLPRPHRYLFIWECKYFRRLITSAASTLAKRIGFCDVNIAQYRLTINHPGEVHNEMVQKTPPLYFSQDQFKLADDPVIKFYRPYADILQDLFDEQAFLNGINHIDKIPAQLIPYLAYLVGWDLPNFPNVSDNVRRSVLKQTVKLQKLKGSKRAINELFSIFGFTIDLVNLWYSSNGERLIAPGESLPVAYAADEIKVSTVQQIDPVLVDYSTNGWCGEEIPLLYRATGDITVRAYLSKPGSTSLTDIANDTDAQIAQQLAALDQSTIISMSEVRVNYKTGRATSSMSTTSVPTINQVGVSYDPITNAVKVTFDHYLTFDDGSKIYVFVYYPRTNIQIPSTVENTRSNRFDVNIALRSGGTPDSLLLEFLLNFVFKLKSFHSLLRKISFVAEVSEVYNVTDYCVDADGGSGAGSEPSCDKEPTSQEVEQQQIATDIYNSLTNEFNTWKRLDGTHRTDPLLEHFLRIPVQRAEGETCQFTQYGQDRTNITGTEKVCADTIPLPSHCFKGRVDDRLEMVGRVPLAEIVRNKPCSLGQGSGTYWTYPQTALSELRNGFGHFDGQLNTGFIGSKITRYGKPLPTSLHYTNRSDLQSYQLETDQLLAYSRPSLEIQKEHTHFPAHRFPVMSNLLNDYVSQDWKAKPWDYEDDVLHAKLVDNYLVYDDAPATYLGNGIQADISSLGSHEDRQFVVTHKMWTKKTSGHPAITLSPLLKEFEGPDELEFDTSVPYGPIFKSYNRACNKDYKSGYPAETGRFTALVGGYDSELAYLLGLPNNGTLNFDSLFSLASGILVTKQEAQYRYTEPYRLDCDCEVFGCDVTSNLNDLLRVDPCIINQYKVVNGKRDFGMDQLDIIPRMILREQVGVCSYMLDGTITNMLSTVHDTCGDIAKEGSYRYKDSHGAIYEGQWTFENNILDITYVTKIPYVWGQKQEGFYRGYMRFVKGIITTTHQKIQVLSDGKFKYLVSLSEQVVDYFQVNALCGDVQFVDNFCFHVNCSVSDFVENLVTRGTRWCVPNEGVEWPELVTDGGGVVTGYSSNTGVQPFIFMDVWQHDVTPVV